MKNENFSSDLRILTIYRMINEIFRLQSYNDAVAFFSCLKRYFLKSLMQYLR
jgi:hypothetical protein